MEVLLVCAKDCGVVDPKDGGVKTSHNHSRYHPIAAATLEPLLTFSVQRSLQSASVPNRPTSAGGQAGEKVEVLDKDFGETSECESPGSRAERRRAVFPPGPQQQRGETRDDINALAAIGTLRLRQAWGPWAVRTLMTARAKTAMVLKFREER